MELRLRGEDEWPPTFRPRASCYIYITEHRIPGVHVDHAIRGGELARSSMGLSEAIRREIEKERIRKEITLEEIVRRRMLVEEVKGELRMERELALRRAEEFSSMALSTKRSESDLMVPLTRYADVNGCEERFPLRPLPETGFSGGLPFQRRPRVALPEVNSSPEICKPQAKHMNHILSRAEKSKCTTTTIGAFAGVKRKGSPPPVGAGKLPTVGEGKKSGKEWLCTLCQVSATSQKDLNRHLRGKKHMAKQALRADSGSRKERKSEKGK